jgi:hypothetical protein
MTLHDAAERSPAELVSAGVLYKDGIPRFDHAHPDHLLGSTVWSATSAIKF